MSITTKCLETPDARRFFLDQSCRDVVTLSSVAIGRGVYRPGWKWSVHVGPISGLGSQHHVGYVLSGRMVVGASDGRQVLVGPGDAFEVSPGHDAWVVGEEPCVALDFAPFDQRGSCSR